MARFTSKIRSLALALSLSAFAKAAYADPASTSFEQGFDLGEAQHPRAVALAGSQVALGTSTSAVLSNPANLVFSRVYHFEGLAAFSPEARRQSYGGAVADSSTSKVAGGLAGTWNVQDPDGAKRTWFDVRAAAAYPIGDKLSVGVAGRYLRLEQPVGTGPLGPSRASSGTPDIAALNRLTFDVGLSLAPIEGLKIGFVGKNLTNIGSSYAPTTVAGGIGYAASIFSIEGDVLVDFTTWGAPKARTMIGGEVFLADHIPLRLGFRNDGGSKTNSGSFGAGYVDKKFSLELGVRREFAENPVTIIGLGFRYFYEAAGVGAGQEPQGEF
jgi:hypothetical protein